MSFDPSFALSWLVGRKISKVEKSSAVWRFTLDDGSYIQGATWWRLINKKRIVVTDGDDEQMFGLTKPVNAAERVMNVVKDQTISAFTVTQIESDLLLYFSDGSRIQILNSSCGYESWETCHKDGQVIISMDGGNLDGHGSSPPFHPK